MWHPCQHNHLLLRRRYLTLRFCRRISWVYWCFLLGGAESISNPTMLSEPRYFSSDSLLRYDETCRRGIKVIPNWQEQRLGAKANTQSYLTFTRRIWGFVFCLLLYYLYPCVPLAARYTVSQQALGERSLFVKNHLKVSPKSEHNWPRWNQPNSLVTFPLWEVNYHVVNSFQKNISPF